LGKIAENYDYIDPRCEKIAQPDFLSKSIQNLPREKSSPRICATSAIFKNLHKENNWANGHPAVSRPYKNSPTDLNVEIAKFYAVYLNCSIARMARLGEFSPLGQFLGKYRRI
jgi:hypothetical protein